MSASALRLVTDEQPAAGGAGKPTVAPLQKLANAFVASRLRTGRWAQSTARGSRYALQRFCRPHGDRPVNQLGRIYVGKWMESLDQMSPATRRTYYGVTREFARWLQAEGHLNRDIFYEHMRPKVPRRMPRGLSAEDMRAIFAECGGDTRMRLIISLMVQEGLRVHEVCKLELGDIDQSAQLLRVIGKGKHERVLPVTDATMKALRAYLADEPMRGSGIVVRARLGTPKQDLVTTAKGMTPVYLCHIISALMFSAGVKGASWDRVASHSLRHTMATDLLRSGAHIRDVQQILGHADLSSTQIYLPLVVHDLRVAMAGRDYEAGPES